MLTKDLVYFREVAQRGSINRAAAALSVTQPTLSKSLQRLERELQVKLLERSSVGVSLTPIGQVFLERTQALGSEVEAVIKTVRDLRLGLSGEVRFAVGGAVPIPLIASACRTFVNKRPGVRIFLRSGLPVAMRSGLEMNDLDFVVCTQHHERRRDIVFAPLITDRWVMAFPNTHCLATKARLTPSDLNKCTWILPSRPNAARAWMDASFRHHGLSPPVPLIENDRLQHALHLALALDAVVIAPQGALRHDAPKLPISNRPFPTPLAHHFDIGIETKAASYLSPQAAGLIEDIRQSFSKGRT